MNDKMEKGLMVGRPFGGLGFLVRKKLNIRTKVVAIHGACRCLAVNLIFPNEYKLLVLITYLPCYSSDASYKDSLLDCIGFMENCIVCTSYDAVTVIGDMNFECIDSSNGYNLFKTFADDYSLIDCDLLVMNKIEYTYYQEGSDKSSFIDHIFVDKKLQNCIIKYDIVDSGSNLSDHLPITCVIALPCIDADSAVKSEKQLNHSKRVKYLRWDKGDLLSYYHVTGTRLQNIRVPISLLSTDCNDLNCCHGHEISLYYKSVVDVLSYSADCCIPALSCNFLKPYWSDALKELKIASVEAHNVWKNNGKPRTGWINQLRLHCKYQYKLAIKEAEEQFANEVDDEISELYLKKDFDRFWRKWNNKFSKRHASPTNVNGLTNDKDIANEFRKSSSDVYFNSYVDTEGTSKCMDTIQNLLLSDLDNSIVDANIFSVTDIENAIKSLKGGKAAGLDSLTKDHIVNSHPAVIVHLKLLFNIIYKHGFVPDDFGVGLSIPIIKDKHGDICSTDNYRTITLSPVISKVFEYCLLHKLQPLLCSSDLQFGFKKKLGCSDAIFVLNQTVDYFVSRGSTVYMAALDARKAFDRVNHVKLFQIMIQQGLPSRFIKIVINWYGKIFSIFKWNNSFSESTAVKSGIRQGGILSPVLFNTYIDVLINRLENLELGCLVGDVYIGCIAYADDIILLSGSVCMLQKMLNVSYTVGAELDIVFNVNKSFLFKVGPAYNDRFINLKIGNQEIAWVNCLKYLGVQFTAARTLIVDTSVQKRKFYASSNCILHNSAHVSEMVRLKLIESYSLPILTYGCETVSLSNEQIRELNVCWNNIYRKIFKFNIWDSVKQVQYFCERLDLIRLYHLRKLTFLVKAFQTDNTVLHECASLVKYSVDFIQLCNIYDLGQLCDGRIVCSTNYLKFSVYSMFETLVLDSQV